MIEQQVKKRLLAILDKLDVDRDHPISRQKSPKHNSSLEILLEHVALLVADLRFDNQCLRQEIKAIEDLLERENDF